MAAVKTAISLPEDLFDAVAALAAERGDSRSGVIADAVRKYLFDLETEAITRSFDIYANPTAEEENEERRWTRRAKRALFEQSDAADR